MALQCRSRRRKETSASCRRRGEADAPRSRARPRRGRGRRRARQAKERSRARQAETLSAQELMRSLVSQGSREPVEAAGRGRRRAPDVCRAERRIGRPGVKADDDKRFLHGHECSSGRHGGCRSRFHPGSLAASRRKLQKIASAPLAFAWPCARKPVNWFSGFRCNARKIPRPKVRPP